MPKSAARIGAIRQIQVIQNRSTDSRLGGEGCARPGQLSGPAGWGPPVLHADGLFGPQKQGMVMAIQSAAGLAGDGIVGR